jgi:hypothetical protein
MLWFHKRIRSPSSGEKVRPISSRLAGRQIDQKNPFVVKHDDGEQTIGRPASSYGRIVSLFSSVAVRMPMVRSLAILVLLAVAVSPCRAAEQPEPQFAVFLHDQTVIRPVHLTAKIEFATKSGKLQVQPADLQRIHFGYHVSAATAKKLESLIQALDGKDFKEREAAQAELVALGAAAHPVLKARLKGAGLEMTGRINEALKQIEEQVPAELLNLPAEDRLFATDASMAGQVANEEIKIRAKFGEVTLKLPLIHSIQVIREATIDALAEKCAIGADSWLETDFQIDSDTALSFSASGKVDLNTTQPGNPTSGPEGLQFQNPGYGQFGVLMGRIGADGPIFPIGKQTVIRTGPQRGKLHLHINPMAGVAEKASVSGSYRVRVATGVSPLNGEPSVDALLYALRQEINALRDEIRLGRMADHLRQKVPNLDGFIPKEPRLGKVAMER